MWILHRVWVNPKNFNNSKGRQIKADCSTWGQYLLVEEGEEVSHHYKDRPGQSEEQFADVKSPLIEIVYSCKQKKVFYVPLCMTVKKSIQSIYSIYFDFLSSHAPLILAY